MRIADEMRFVRGWLMIAMTALLLACGGGGGGGDGAVNPNVAYTYRPPAEIADGWRVAHARDLGSSSCPRSYDAIRLPRRAVVMPLLDVTARAAPSDRALAHLRDSIGWTFNAWRT